MPQTCVMAPDNSMLAPKVAAVAACAEDAAAVTVWAATSVAFTLVLGISTLNSTLLSSHPGSKSLKAALTRR